MGQSAVEQRPVLPSYLLGTKGSQASIVLRSSHPTAQRFDLARLLGDRLLFETDTPFSPVTRAYTFRQKAQRAFAAELLCPFEAVQDMLAGDHSEQAIEEVAQHFFVSPLTVETQLRNHGLIDRDSFADAA